MPAQHSRSIALASLVTLVTLVALPGCDCDDDPGQTEDSNVNLSAVLDLQGGELESRGMRLTVPAGALGEPTEIRVRTVQEGLEQPLPPRTELVSRAYALTPHGTRFALDVELELPYEPPEGNRQLRIARLDDEDDTSWENVRGARFDGETERARVRVDRFSIYAVVSCDADADRDCGLDTPGAPDSDGGVATDAGPGGGSDGGDRPDGGTPLDASSDGGVVVDGPSLAVSPASVDFGDVPVGTDSVAATLSFENTGTGAASGCEVSVSDATFSTFDDGCSGGSLEPSASCTVNVRATPAAAGQFDGSVDLSCDSGVTASADVAVLGATPQLSVTPSSHFFGPVPGGTTSTPAAFTFRNDGTAPATGCLAPALSGEDPGVFTLAQDNCGTAALQPGESCTVVVSMSPALADTLERSATLQRSCTVGGTAASDPGGLRGNLPHYLFISSVGVFGDMSSQAGAATPDGLAGADSLCQQAADEGDASAALGSLTWRALLSTAGVNPPGDPVYARDRVAWRGPVFDVMENFAVADPGTWPWTHDGAVGGPPPLSMDENGNFATLDVWTGSTVNGEVAANTCDDWTDGTRDADGHGGQTGSFPDNSWFEGTDTSCTNIRALICVSEAQ